MKNPYTTRPVIREQSRNSSPGEGIWWICHHRRHDTPALRWSSWGKWWVGLIWLFFLHQSSWGPVIDGSKTQILKVTGWLGIRFCFISDIFCCDFWRKKEIISGFDWEYLSDSEDWTELTQNLDRVWFRVKLLGIPSLFVLWVSFAPFVNVIIYPFSWRGDFLLFFRVYRRGWRWVFWLVCDGWYDIWSHMGVSFRLPLGSVLLLTGCLPSHQIEKGFF